MKKQKKTENIKHCSSWTNEQPKSILIKRLEKVVKENQITNIFTENSLRQTFRSFLSRASRGYGVTGGRCSAPPHTSLVDPSWPSSLPRERLGEKERDSERGRERGSLRERERFRERERQRQRILEEKDRAGNMFNRIYEFMALIYSCYAICKIQNYKIGMNNFWFLCLCLGCDFMMCFVWWHFPCACTCVTHALIYRRIANLTLALYIPVYLTICPCLVIQLFLSMALSRSFSLYSASYTRALCISVSTVYFSAVRNWWAAVFAVCCWFLCLSLFCSDYYYLTLSVCKRRGERERERDRERQRGWERERRGNLGMESSRQV